MDDGVLWPVTVFGVGCRVVRIAHLPLMMDSLCLGLGLIHGMK